MLSLLVGVSGAVVEPFGACLVASAPPDPSQVVGFGQESAVGQVEQAFDLGDGQGDQSGVVGWLLVGPGRQDRRWCPSFRLGGGDRADRKRGHGQHGVAQ